MILIYLASPYTHENSAVRIARFEAVLDAQAALMRKGHAVYSPIGSSHSLQQRHELPCEWSYWQAIDELIIGRCDELHVLMIEGWRESVGVKAEIAIAEQQGKPVRYIDPHESNG